MSKTEHFSVERVTKSSCPLKVYGDFVHLRLNSKFKDEERELFQMKDCVQLLKVSDIRTPDMKIPASS